MAGVLSSVDSRTNLVGQNRLEILMFRLNGQQTYAINVFKVQEVMALPKVTRMPQRHRAVIGVVYLRGRAIPVMDLSLAIGMRATPETEDSTIIVTEYNSTVQAFLVGQIDRIVNLNWEEILPPPSGAGRHHYLTAITHHEDRIVEIIDVEKVLAEIAPMDARLPDEIMQGDFVAKAQGREIVMVDDSHTALTQASSTFESLGLIVHRAMDGVEGLALLRRLADETDTPLEKRLLMLVTDAEMPRMDGYRMTTEIRSDPKLKNLYIALHTSLSGQFNKAMVEKVGCDAFLSKFHPEQLANLVKERIEALED
ncbi:chemotaxis protein [Saccharospirillum alexandrii]|uniref:chemotaxis protein n=1 Tax=Saccharospirillum alexandrii TaxID=2448477 RepID=UPI000FD8803C|nr:chemotaxis protein [Saccharospirillum alexandrii]